MNAIRRFRHWLRQTTGCSCCLIGVLLLASSTENSCSSSTKEAEPEAFSGTYRVTVFPAVVRMPFNGAPVQVTITATCVGEKLPPNCQSNPPDWTIPIGGYIGVNIQDVNAPATTGLVTVLAADLDSSSLAGEYLPATARITPRNVPRGLTVKGGVLHVVIEPRQ